MSVKNPKLEEKLVKQMCNGDTLAFETLFNEYSYRLYRFALGYLPCESDAEEVVQEVFYKVWITRSSLKSVSSFKSYLFTIAFNVIRTFFNKRNQVEKYKQQLSQELSFFSDTESSKVDYHELMGFVEKLIGDLPEKRRQIFLMNKKEGLDTHEIAEYLNVAEKTVRNQLSLAMAELKEAVKEKGIAEFLFLFLIVFL